MPITYIKKGNTEKTGSLEMEYNFLIKKYTRTVTGIEARKLTAAELSQIDHSKETVLFETDEKLELTGLINHYEI